VHHERHGLANFDPIHVSRIQTPRQIDHRDADEAPVGFGDAEAL